MDATTDALRHTSDALLRDLDVLVALEDEKRALVAGDPKVSELSTRIEEIARRVLGDATRQRSLSEDAEAEVGSAAGSRPIGAESRPIGQILADWRETERRLAGADPDSVDAAEARALVEHLRNEYRVAQRRASTTG